MAKTKSIELVPVGSFIFLDRDTNPAELFQGTSWEIYENGLYITTKEQLRLDDNGRPTGDYDKLRCWIRLT